MFLGLVARELAEREEERALRILARLETGPVGLRREPLSRLHVRNRADETLLVAELRDLLLAVLVHLDGALRTAVESRLADLLGEEVGGLLPRVGAIDRILDRRGDRNEVDGELGVLALGRFVVAVLATGDRDLGCRPEAETEADDAGHAAREARAVDLLGLEDASCVHRVAPAVLVVGDRALRREDDGVAALALAARAAEKALEVSIVLHADAVEEDPGVFVVKALGSLEHVAKEDDCVLLGRLAEEIVDVVAGVDGRAIGLRARLRLGLRVADVILDAAIVEKTTDLLEGRGLSGLARGARTEEVLARRGVEAVHEVHELVHNLGVVEIANVLDLLQTALLLELLDGEVGGRHIEVDDLGADERASVVDVDEASGVRRADRQYADVVRDPEIGRAELLHGLEDAARAVVLGARDVRLVHHDEDVGELLVLLAEAAELRLDARETAVVLDGDLAAVGHALDGLLAPRVVAHPRDDEGTIEGELDGFLVFLDELKECVDDAGLACLHESGEVDPGVGFALDKEGLEDLQCRELLEREDHLIPLIIAEVIVREDAELGDFNFSFQATDVRIDLGHLRGHFARDTRKLRLVRRTTNRCNQFIRENTKRLHLDCVVFSFLPKFVFRGAHGSVFKSRIKWMTRRLDKQSQCFR